MVPAESLGQGSLDFAIQVLELATGNITQRTKEKALQPAERSALAGIAATLHSLSTPAAREDSSGGQPMNTADFTLTIVPPPVILGDVHHEPAIGQEIGLQESASMTATKADPESNTNAGPSTGIEMPVCSGDRSASTSRTTAVQKAEQKIRQTRRLVVAFHLADLDRNGIVSVSELRHCLIALGTPEAAAASFVHRLDANGDGEVSQDEFLALCEEPEFKLIVEKLETLCSKETVVQLPRDSFMLAPHSTFRCAWDIFILAILLVVAVSVPLSLGFDTTFQLTPLAYLDLTIDCIFLTDIVLNFRTGFVASGGFEVMKASKVAKHYLKTWFLVDLVSSLPYKYMEDDLTSGLTGLRLLKTFKIVRSLKLVRVMGVWKSLRYVTVLDKLEALRASGSWSYELSLLKLLFIMFLICHWLGCIMAWSADGCVEPCETGTHTASFQHQYTASLYWAFTTITTVGYGDISPSSVLGRVCAMFAMVVGGSFYAFVIGNITSAVTTQSENDQIYSARMGEVQAWLDFHRFPAELSHQVRKYLSINIRHKPPPDEEQIMSQLSPELQSKLAYWMVSREVRLSPMLTGLPSNVIRRLCLCANYLTIEEGENIVTSGELGYAMFFITTGKVAKLHPDAACEPEVILELGDSFGEEVLCGLESKYHYTVVARSSSGLQSLPCAGLAREVENVPMLMDILRHNYHCRAKAVARIMAAETLKV